VPAVLERVVLGSSNSLYDVHIPILAD
jgi:hypothetical protein